VPLTQILNSAAPDLLASPGTEALADIEGAISPGEFVGNATEISTEAVPPVSTGILVLPIEVTRPEGSETCILKTALGPELRIDKLVVAVAPRGRRTCRGEKNTVMFIGSIGSESKLNVCKSFVVPETLN